MCKPIPALTSLPAWKGLSGDMRPRHWHKCHLALTSVPPTGACWWAATSDKSMSLLFPGILPLLCRVCRTAINTFFFYSVTSLYPTHLTPKFSSSFQEHDFCNFPLTQLCTSSVHIPSSPLVGWKELVNNSYIMDVTSIFHLASFYLSWVECNRGHNLQNCSPPDPLHLLNSTKNEQHCKIYISAHYTVYVWGYFFVRLFSCYLLIF